MGFESTLGWKLLYREELREEPIIDAHRYTADVAIHIHIILTHHGQSFKTPPAYLVHNFLLGTVFLDRLGEMGLIS